MAVTLSSLLIRAAREGHLAARVLRRNVALPTERNPGVLVRLPIWALLGARDDKRHARPVLFA
jgi:hypothetical protein